MIKIACNITHIGQNHVQFAKHDPLPGLALASSSATAEAFSEWGGFSDWGELHHFRPGSWGPISVVFLLFLKFYLKLL